MRNRAGHSDAFQVIKSLAIGAVAALTLSVLVLPGGDEGAAPPAERPAAPDVLDAVWREPAPADDGLVDLIVRPTGVPAGTTGPNAAAEPEDGAPVDDAGIGATDGSSDWTIEGGDGELVIVEGELMRRDASGALVPASGGAADGDDVETVSVPAAPAVSFGHPTIDALAARDGVERVAPIGDGSFAVTVTDAAVLADLPLDAVEDVPVALFADPYESYQWALENTGSNLNGVSNAPAQTADADIDVADAWPRATGDGVVVAIIDSGVDFSHPDLAPNRWTNTGETCGNGVDDDGNGFVDDCHGWDFAYDDNQPYNPGAHAHGTHVAGIVAAEGGNGIGITGVAPDAQIMDLNVGTVTGGSPGITTSAIARAVRYAADNGADVINMSLGTSPGVPRSAMATLESAIVYAGERGALIVVAAGNDTASLDGGNTAWPASYDFPYMVTVAASAPNETLAFFSNYGSVVDVAAPGHVILSTVPGSYGFMSGTSQASPVVAGIAALALDANPSLGAAGVRDAIRSSSDRHDAYVGRVPDGLRANAGNLVAGTTPEVGFDEVAISVAGLAGADDLAPVTAVLDIVVPTDEYDEAFSWNATLVAMETDGDYVVIDHEVAVNGAITTTGEDGAVDLALGGTGTVELATVLPQGRYALVLEPLAVADPSSRLGDAFVAAFDVADGSTPTTVPAPTTTVVASPSPSPSPTTTVAPQPGGSPTSTAAPNPGGSPTPPAGTPSPTTTAAPSAGSPSPTTTAAPSAGSPSPTTTTAPSAGSPSPSPTPTTTAPAPGVPVPSPTTTVPSGGSPSPTTTVPSSGSPAPTPTTTIPPVSSGGWSVTGVLPGEGWVDSMNLVRLTGSFPEAAYVWFGEQPGIVVASSPYTIDVLTPLRGTAGVVDIALVPPGSTAVLTVPSAYTFVAAGGPTPSPSPTPDPNTPTTTVAPSPNPSPTPTTTVPGGSGTSPTTTVPGGSTGGATPTTTVAPSPSPTPTTTTLAPTDPGTAPPPTTVAPGAGGGETIEETTARRPRAVLGDRFDLGSGLRGRPITGASPLGSVALCSSDPCSLT